jgi:hypothetical protein
MFNNLKRFHMASGTRSSLIVMRDTRAWQLQVWVSFGLAVFLCATGLAYLPGQALDRAFMVMGYVFCRHGVPGQGGARFAEGQPHG